MTRLVQGRSTIFDTKPKKEISLNLRDGSFFFILLFSWHINVKILDYAPIELVYIFK